jgi:hypothetical protein
LHGRHERDADGGDAMRRLIEAIFRGLGSRLMRAPAEAAIALLDGRADTAADRLRIALADSHFNEGDYAAARAAFASVGNSRHGAKARQMTDWIDFKFGDVGRGWPRYPGADFDPQAHAPGFAPAGTPIRVENPNHPAALVSEMGLPVWHPGMSTGKPVLVWFNFKASLGGELLCAKVVKRLEQVHGLPMVLACDARLGDVMRANFPGCEIIDKEGDLSGLSGRCSAFLPARDALALVVRSQADFAPIAGSPFALPEARTRMAGERPQVAISWKTTNRTQGRYRNIPTTELASLLSRFDADFHSAQHGVTPKERRILESSLGGRIHFDTIDTKASVGALAASLASTDAVVTIDNSVLHIAGTFGIPAAGLLSVPSYWAWPSKGPASRWYESVTLMHQQRPGEWADVLGELAAYLDRLVGATSSVRAPAAR